MVRAKKTEVLACTEGENRRFEIRCVLIEKAEPTLRIHAENMNGEAEHR